MLQNNENSDIGSVGFAGNGEDRTVRKSSSTSDAAIKTNAASNNIKSNSTVGNGPRTIRIGEVSASKRSKSTTERHLPPRSNSSANLEGMQNTSNASGRATHTQVSVEKNPFTSAKKYNTPAITVISVMVLYLISELLLSGNYINSSNPYVSVVIAQFCVYLIPCAFFFAFSSYGSRVTPRDFGFRIPPLKLWGFGTSSLFALVFGGMIIKYAGYLIFGTVSSAAVSVSASSDWLYVLLSGVLVPSVTEEILFRGVVFGSYERKLGSFAAILASSVLFAFIHFDSTSFVSYLYAGIVLGIAATVTRSVITPIILHFLNNFICIFSDTYLQRISKESISTVFVVFILTALLLATLFFYFESLELFCREKAFNTAASNTRTQTPRLFVKNESVTITFARAFLAPAFIIAFAIYLIKVFTM